MNCEKSGIIGFIAGLLIGLVCARIFGAIPVTVLKVAVCGLLLMAIVAIVTVIRALYLIFIEEAREEELY